MANILITGIWGLVGSSVAETFLHKGHNIYGIDNDYRSHFFKDIKPLSDEDKEEFESRTRSTVFNVDISEYNEMLKVFQNLSDKGIDTIVHCAAQPSHDWAAKDPLLDFKINAMGTLILCRLTHEFFPDAKLIHFSTNKVYGDNPNKLDLHEEDLRYDVSTNHEYYNGIKEDFPVDHCKHSLFGCSKLSADLYMQEYARYFGIKTVILRGGCLTGGNHRGAKLHGFLNYLVKCSYQAQPYEIIGFRGKQVRDNLHSSDIGNLCLLIHEADWTPEDFTNNVYNLGGGRNNSVSILEVMSILSSDFSLSLNTYFNEIPREGDHQWYISDISKLRERYGWYPIISTKEIISEIVSKLK